MSRATSIQPPQNSSLAPKMHSSFVPLPNLDEQSSETDILPPRPLALRPLSWAESLSDDRPAFISQQLPFPQRPHLEPREATIVKTDTLVELAQFFKDNPRPPRSRKLLPANFGLNDTSPRKKLVKRQSRASKISSTSVRTSESGYRGTVYSIRSPKTKSNVSQPKLSGFSNPSDISTTTDFSSISFKSVPNTFSRFWSPKRQDEQLGACPSNLDPGFINSKRDSIKNGPSGQGPSVANLQQSRPQSTIAAVTSNSKQNTLPTMPDISSPSTPNSKLRPFTWDSSPHNHSKTPPGSAPQKPLPAVPISIASRNKPPRTKSEASAHDGATEVTSTRYDRTDSITSITSSGIFSISTTGSMRKSVRDERTRARKLKHLHGKDQSHTADTKRPDSGGQDSLYSAREPMSTPDRLHIRGQYQTNSHGFSLPLTTNGAPSAPSADENASNSAVYIGSRESAGTTEEQMSSVPTVQENLWSVPETGDAQQPQGSNMHASGDISYTSPSSSTYTPIQSTDGASYETVQPDTPSHASSGRRKKKRASVGHVQHLNERIAHLERENQLLEAALMAVLKTGGSLMKCPCGGLGFEQAMNLYGRQSLTTDTTDFPLADDSQNPAEATQGSSKSPMHSASLFETPPTSAGVHEQFYAAEEGDAKEEKARWSCYSAASGRESLARSSLSSALALYTHTRAPLPGSFSRGKAHST